LVKEKEERKNYLKGDSRINQLGKDSSEVLRKEGKVSGNEGIGKDRSEELRWEYFRVGGGLGLRKN